jgi:hypothetical protein
MNGIGETYTWEETVAMVEQALAARKKSVKRSEQSSE